MADHLVLPGVGMLPCPGCSRRRLIAEGGIVVGSQKARCSQEWGVALPEIGHKAHLTGKERENFPAYLILAEKAGTSLKALPLQIGEQAVNGRAEGAHSPPHRISYLDDSVDVAAAKRNLWLAHLALPRQFTLLLR